MHKNLPVLFSYSSLSSLRHGKLEAGTWGLGLETWTWMLARLLKYCKLGDLTTYCLSGLEAGSLSWSVSGVDFLRICCSQLWGCWQSSVFLGLWNHHHGLYLHLHVPSLCVYLWPVLFLCKDNLHIGFRCLPCFIAIVVTPFPNEVTLRCWASSLQHVNLVCGQGHNSTHNPITEGQEFGFWVERNVWELRKVEWEKACGLCGNVQMDQRSR